MIVQPVTTRTAKIWLRDDGLIQAEAVAWLKQFGE